jgi:hypothetical protein
VKKLFKSDKKMYSDFSDSVLEDDFNSVKEPHDSVIMAGEFV